VIVYCGSLGGFEPTGSSVTFTTPIPAPIMTLGAVTSTTVALTWTADDYATWHRVEYFADNSKRSTTTVAAEMQTGSGMTVTGLSPGTSYTIHIYSGSGSSSSGYEPYGTVVQVQTKAGPAAGDSNAGLSSGTRVFLKFCYY